MSRKLLKSLKVQKSQTEQVKLTIYGSLGIFLGGQKVIQVPNRQGYVYVRLRDNQNEVIQAFNNKVAASYDLPVIVVREGGRYIVQQYNSQRYQNNAQNSAPFLPGHGTQHSFPRGGGADVTWVYPQQFMPALVFPESTTGTTVRIDRYPLLNPNGQWIYAGGTGTQNILQYLPTTGSSSLMTLVYMDALTGNPGILVGSGSYFPANITGSIYPYIPSPSSTQIPLAGVLLNTGTQRITWDNIYDVRQWIHATPSGTSSGGGGGGVDTTGFVGQDKGIYLATGTILNVNGTRLIMSVSGTVFNLTNSPDPYDNIGIYGLSGTTGLGTGTSISFGNGIISSITGTILYASVHFGTGTNQVASGNRGVTNGDTHNHVGGDGAALNYTDVIAAFWNSVTVPASTTYYGAPFKVGVDATTHSIPWAEGGVLSNMSVRISSSQPASGSLVITLQVNGVDTSIVVTIAAGTVGPATVSDTTHTATISATDTLRWKVVNNATAASSALTSVSMLNTKQTT